MRGYSHGALLALLGTPPRYKELPLVVIIVIMYIYHALINALSAHMIHINLNTIFYAHVERSPTETIYIKYYTKTNKKATKNAL